MNSIIESLQKSNIISYGTTDEINSPDNMEQLSIHINDLINQSYNEINKESENKKKMMSKIGLNIDDIKNMTDVESEKVIKTSIVD